MATLPIVDDGVPQDLGSPRERGAAPAASTTYDPRGPLDLGATLAPLRHGPYDPTVALGPRGGWVALRTPHGTATLRIEARDAVVHADAWGAGAEWAVASVPELCGAGDDVSDFDAAAHPAVREARRRQPGLRLTRTSRVLDALAPAVLEQLIHSSEAHRAWRTLVRKHGVPAPGSGPDGPAPGGLMVAPDADGWRRVPVWDWRRAGISETRGAMIARAAAVAPALERTLALGRGGPEASRRLRSLPGVGAWTAAETLQRAHGDPDAPSFGDLHVPAAVGWALTGSAVDDAGMAELLVPWAGHRQRVVRLLLRAYGFPPRRAPRAAVPRHRRW
ncbi:conserved hypothetical protein [Beutenbergia cavernae DSM 12333]|uniref:3-methyladenine DNA glycosylase/8-oxoguanine DNA glycosylase-like protein n=1 Tax=Beutenbergia cavernae (strain ATCC BAA-8 / DSM 12333 / CCUG 43141 / JCM 11478 / NBRC 16432 / NCIMB 13614 / HKI 0122) TaxID=471853 RepID=C5BUX5_BEUC1|nr:3-methyladenine DNA glycosylase [Beutenbergia cavernae]ACQ78349.1 conserved hypothetical protein [Beutenbergia cavernae DSM 12333]